MVDDRIFVSASLDFWENFADFVDDLSLRRCDMVDGSPGALLLDEFYFEVVPRIEQAKKLCKFRSKN